MCSSALVFAGTARILAPADIKFVVSFPRYGHLKITKGPNQISLVYCKSLALSHQGPWRCSVWLLVRSYTSVQWSKLDQCTAVYSSSLSSLAHHQKWVFRQCFILQWNRHIHHKNIARIANAVTITLYSKVTMYLVILLFSIVRNVISVSSVKSQVTKTFKKSENFQKI